MRPLLFGLLVAALPVAAIAQGGPMGGGGRGGGMGGGMGGGGMGGGHRGGGMGRPQGGPPPQMKPIDRDKMDGPVTDMFRAADLDKDGIVTLDELRTVLGRKRAAIIATRFKAIDTNGDKLIDEKEFDAWQQSLGTVAASDDEARGAGSGIVAETLPPDLGKSREDQMLRRIIEPLSATLLVSANTNYDKGMSLEELLAYEHQRFDNADTDKDGKLSAEEMRALAPKGGQRGGGRRPMEGGGSPAQDDDAEDAPSQ